MSYLGRKGYTIYKKDLTNKEQIFIRNELTVKPYLPKSPQQPEPFPIYRESPQKLYVPRYFGIENFGEVGENKIPLGCDIDLNFQGELREFQINIVDKYLNFVKDSGGGLLDVDPGKGKTVMALYIISKLKKKNNQITDLKNKEVKAILFDKYLRETNNTKNKMQPITSYFK
jgi:hypothetical protein